MKIRSDCNFYLFKSEMVHLKDIGTSLCKEETILNKTDNIKAISNN